MDLLLGLDAIAAERGDGLRPELRALLRRRAEAPRTDPIVIEASICAEDKPEPRSLCRERALGRVPCSAD